MPIRTRTTYLLRASLLALSLEGCGGKVDPATLQVCPATESCDDAATEMPETEPPPDTSISQDSLDLPSDTADAATCGQGPCRPGDWCMIDKCTRAACLGDGGWSESVVCLDTGPACPAARPADGATCAPEGSSCSYAATCGNAKATCSGGVWHVVDPRCPGAGCPPSEPASGSSCDPATVSACPYANSCGSSEFMFCDSSMKVWRVTGACNGCPMTEPQNGSSCGASNGSQSCTWANACGSKDVGICRSYRWQIDTAGCTPAGCPTAVPKLGDACATVGLACYWPCDKAYCASTGWVPTNNTCAVCPGAEPADRSPCAPGGLACRWSNACGGTDEGYCNATLWMISPGPCSTPSDAGPPG